MIYDILFFWVTAYITIQDSFFPKNNRLHVKHPNIFCWCIRIEFEEMLQRYRKYGRSDLGVTTKINLYRLL